MPGTSVAGQLKCQIITPERQVLAVEADFVVLTTDDGQMGSLPEHSSLLCRLAPSLMRIDVGGKRNIYFVNSGFVEVLENHVAVLTSEAIAADDLAPNEIAVQLATAEQLVPTNAEQRAERFRLINVARAKQGVYLIAKGDDRDNH